VHLCSPFTPAQPHAAPSRTHTTRLVPCGQPPGGPHAQALIQAGVWQVDRHIGHDNLFKRSIILVRVPLCSSVAWHIVS
jgi:hypothetical protein